MYSRKYPARINNNGYGKNIINMSIGRRCKMADIAFDDQVDITDKVCPLTFVKAKVAIEELDDGEVLAIRMNDGEPVQNVPRSMKEEGHKILKLEDNEDGTYTLYVRKVED